MKEWKNPELWKLDAEYTESGYTGNSPDGTFIDISPITHIPGSHAILVKS